MANSPILYGPNSLATNLQNRILQATGEVLENNGPKNYIGYNNFENGLTTGWGLGTVGTLTNGIPTGTPTFGSGASGNLSISTVSSGIDGQSLSYASSAATTQGNMLHTDALSVDAADRAQVLTFKFYYSVPTNPSNGNFSGTSSNSFGVAAYDVTNSSWLPITGQFSMTQNSGVGIATGTMQTNITTASVRFCIYNVNATSGAITLYFDRFFLGPQTASYGPVATDWVTYTPTISGFGSVSSVEFVSRREGDSLRIRGKFTSGTVADSTASVTLGFNGINANVTSADTTKIQSIADGGKWVRQTSGGSVDKGGSILISPSTGTVTFGPVETFGANSTSTALTSKNGNTIAVATDVIALDALIPIAGWSSNVQMSNDTDTRVVAAGAYLPSPVALSANVPINMSVVTFDSHASITTGAAWKFTAPVTGYYQVNFIGWTSSTVVNFYLSLNGSAYSTMFATGSGAESGSLLIPMTAGQYIDMRADGAATINSSSITINRLSGPSVIAATETVACRYTSSSTAIGTTLAALVNPTRSYDTHLFYNSSTGVATIPVSGKYRITAMTATAIASSSAPNTSIFTVLFVNGVQRDTLGVSRYQVASVSLNNQLGAATTYQLNAGDTVEIRAVRDSQIGAVSCDGTSQGNYICIERVGN
jgi:hypothetical protein